MTDGHPPGADSPAGRDGPTGPAPQVRALLMTCNACRRARAATLQATRTGTATRPGLPRLTMQRPTLHCPHIPDVWAAGFGPGAPPPPGSGWDTRPNGPA